MLLAALVILSVTILSTAWFVPLHVSALAFILNLIGYAEWDCLRLERDFCAFRFLFENALYAAVLARLARAVVLECALYSVWPPGYFQQLLRGTAFVASLIFGSKLLVAPILAGVVALKAIALDKISILGFLWLGIAATFEYFEAYVLAATGSIAALALLNRAKHERGLPGPRKRHCGLGR